jgi:DNA-binding winged helix-turn-helix (wHTH) protein
MAKVISRWRETLAALRRRNSYRLWILLSLFAVCTLFYYFGELVDFAGWQSLRWEFFYTVHDVHRLFFLAPIVYAGYSFRIKGAVIATIASFMVFLPYAIFVSTFPDAMLRAVLFTLIAGVLGILAGRMRNQFEQRRRLRSRALVTNDKEDEVFTAGDLEIDLSKQLVRRRGQIVKLTATEYKLLAYLISNRGRIVTHTELLRSLWGPEYGGESEYIRVFIGQLRRKIEEDPSNPKFIVTEPRMGYRLVEPEYHER